jgi:hypothetical protein
MVACLSELQIELLVLKLGQTPGLQLPLHLKECEFCTSNYEDILKFYSQFDAAYKEIDQSSLSQRIAGKQQRSKSKIYRFCALHLLQKPRPDPVYSKTLAADSELSALAPEIHNVGVYTSNDEQLMVRILKGSDDSYSLYLLSDTAALYQNVLVRIVGFDFDYISDQTGFINLGAIDLPDPDTLGIEIRTPAQSYDLKNHFPGVGSLIGEGEISIDKNDDCHVQMEIISVEDKLNLKVKISQISEAGGRDNIRVVVIKKDLQAEVKSFVKGVALFEDIQDPANIHIKIFA